MMSWWNSVEPIPLGQLRFERKLLSEGRGGQFGGPIYDWPSHAGDAWLFSLDQRWINCRIDARYRALNIEDAAERIRPGMSGSPIVTTDGAVGLVSVSIGFGADGQRGHTSGGPNPVLSGCLPGWLLRELA